MVMSKVSTLVSKDIGNYLTNRSSWNIFYNAKAEGLAGDGTTDDYADLSTLINTTINGAEATIIFSPGTYKISTSITIPSNINLFLTKGAMLSPDSGKTITINGPVEAGVWKIFTGSGTIAGSMKVDTVYPQWWGAVGGGVTDDTVAIQAAIDSMHYSDNPTSIPEMGVLYFPKGTYNISAPLNIKGAIIVRGSGRNTTILKNTTVNTSSLKVLESTGINAGTGITIEDLQVTGAIGALATAGNGIEIGYNFTQTVVNVNILRCDILGHYNGIALGNIVMGSIDQCLIQSAGNDGLITSGTMNAFSIRNTYSQSNIRHGYNFKGNYCAFYNTASDSNGGNAYNFHKNSTTDFSRYITMTSIGAEVNTGSALNIDYGLNFTIENCFFNPSTDHVIQLTNVTGFKLVGCAGLTPTAGKYGIFQTNTTQLILEQSYLSAPLGLSNDYSNMVSSNLQLNTFTPNIQVGRTQTSKEPLGLSIPATGEDRVMILERPTKKTWHVDIDSGGGLKIAYTNGVFPIYVETGVLLNRALNVGLNGVFSILGFIQQSPDGVYHRIKIANDGTLSTEIVAST